jgi:hypothetical protein
LHHIIASYRIASHHTSYHINDTNWKRSRSSENALQKMKRCQGTKQAENYSFISSDVQKEICCLRSFDVEKVWMVLTRHKNSSLQSMKRREGIFSPKAQKRYVHKVSCIAKNSITNNLHITLKNVNIKHYRLSSPNITLIS